MIKKVKAFLEKTIVRIKEAVVYDEGRQKVMFIGLNIILSLVAFTMSIVNIFTKEYILMYFTLAFSILCVLNVLLFRTRIPKKVLYIAFTLETMGLICFFFISGIPDGFSALWACLIPSFALLFFGGKKGGIFCVVELFIIVFLFWIPFGKSLLQYNYSETFLLRFPFLYIAIYFISLLVELIRSQTQQHLQESEEKYHFLYRHDALTGLYNRYGFNEFIEKAFKSLDCKKISIILFDIDDFKKVNDSYGHLAGDEVLKSIASIMRSVLCESCQMCRWGGEEFMIIMKCDHDPMEIAEKIRSLVEESAVKYEGHDIHITISLGVAVVNDIRLSTINKAITQADDCLYKSKGKGKNKITAAII